MNRNRTWSVSPVQFFSCHRDDGHHVDLLELFGIRKETVRQTERILVLVSGDIGQKHRLAFVASTIALEQQGQEMSSMLICKARRSLLAWASCPGALQLGSLRLDWPIRITAAFVLLHLFPPLPDTDRRCRLFMYAPLYRFALNRVQYTAAHLECILFNDEL